MAPQVLFGPKSRKIPLQTTIQLSAPFTFERRCKGGLLRDQKWTLLFYNHKKVGMKSKSVYGSCDYKVSGADKGTVTTIWLRPHHHALWTYVRERTCCFGRDFRDWKRRQKLDWKTVSVLFLGSAVSKRNFDRTSLCVVWYVCGSCRHLSCCRDDSTSTLMSECC